MSALSPILPVYRRSSTVMVRGEGMRLEDASGKSYLDFAAGIAVCALGHRHPSVVAALHRQADELWHCSNLFSNPLLEPVSARLMELSGIDGQVFFSSSGLEANEAALKFIRKWMDATRRPERYRIITMKGGFHGRSMAMISACQSPRAVEGFGPLLDGFDQVPFHDLAAFEAAIGPETAGILLEPVQGEGGVHAHSAEYLQAARALADKHEIALWFDEVQCGLGRTGTLFTYQAAGVVPDIVTIAKGLGNGFPIGATLVQDRIATAMTPGSHGSTFGSNPLALSVAQAVLTELAKPDLLANVQARGAELAEGLAELVAAHPHVLAEARGVGLILGIETKVSAYVFMDALREAGLLVVAAGDRVVRLLPPLILTEEDVRHALSILHQVCQSWNPA